MFIKNPSSNLKNSTVSYGIRLKYGVPSWIETLLIKENGSNFFLNTEQVDADPDLEL